jgi:uncharacterized protein
MSAHAAAALHIDALRLIRNKETASGKFAAHELPRVADYLRSLEGAVEYRIEGGQDARQRPFIRCIINGYLELVCQRCLGPIQFAVSTDQRLIVVGSETAMPAPEDEEDEVDFIVAAPKFDVLALVEDEIILSLPLAPRHAEQECAADGVSSK